MFIRFLRSSSWTPPPLPPPVRLPTRSWGVPPNRPRPSRLLDHRPRLTRNGTDPTRMFAVRCRGVAAAGVVHRRAGPSRAHRHRPEQRAGLRRVPSATVVAVRPGRGRSPGRRVHRAARRQVRAADRARRAGPGRPSGRAPRTADGPRLSVRSAATATGGRRRLSRVPVPAAAIAVARRRLRFTRAGRRSRLDRRGPFPGPYGIDDFFFFFFF